MNRVDTNYLAILPYEILYKTLMPLPYRDIIAYCDSDPSSTICDDNLFWLDKLDRELQYTNAQGVLMKPSDYVIRYGPGNERGIDVYVSWIEQKHNNIHEMENNIRRGYNDIVIWTLNDGNRTQEDYDWLANAAAEYNNIALLEVLIQNNIFPHVYGADSAAVRGHLKVLLLLARYGIFPLLKVLMVQHLEVI